MRISDWSSDVCSSDLFIEDAARTLPKGLWVDFRGQRSIHWKLYLIAPKTVIIGSANLTGMGLDLTRDTCVVVKNQSLYDDRSEGRRVGKECVSTCRSRWSPCH